MHAIYNHIYNAVRESDMKQNREKPTTKVQKMNFVKLEHTCDRSGDKIEE